MKKSKMTKRQKDVLTAIEEYVEEKGYSPSYRELSEMLGINSASTISTHLEQLKRKGYVSFIPGQPRTISIIAS